MKSSESTKGSKVSAKKLASKSVKAAAKVAALKEKKIAGTVIKDTHMAGFVNFIREQGVVGLAVGLVTVEVAGRKGEFLYGAFVSSLITLIAVAFVVYAIVHFFKLDKLDKKKD